MPQPIYHGHRCDRVPVHQSGSEGVYAHSGLQDRHRTALGADAVERIRFRRQVPEQLRAESKGQDSVVRSQRDDGSLHRQEGLGDLRHRCGGGRQDAEVRRLQDDGRHQRRHRVSQGAGAEGSEGEIQPFRIEDVQL